MKKIIIIITALAALLIIYGTSVAVDYNKAVSKYGNPVEVTIAPGSSDAAIAKTLKAHKLIKREWAFKLKLKNSEYAGKLKYGTFALNDGMCMPDIIKIVAEGGSLSTDIVFMIPEGFTVELIADKAEQLGLCTKEDFLAAANESYSYDFLADIPDNVNYRLQGFLFPDTYIFAPETDAKTMIEAMLDNFKSKFDSIGKNNAALSTNELITLASLIEKETRLDSERATVSGVIFNRMSINMLLQIDATVAYVITDGTYEVEVVLYKDLENRSLYNTYRHAGLPIGPICNPGEKSIAAAMNPESHDYLYYHTDETKKDGSHIFNKTYAEHNATLGR